MISSKRLITILPIVLGLAFLWFPFDWLSTVWPSFGVPFRLLFHDARSHLIGHAIFFLVIGSFILARLPALQRKPQYYLVGLVVVALIQESIQAFFRGQLPVFNDFNAFTGDAIGGGSALALSWIVILSKQMRDR